MNSFYDILHDDDIVLICNICHEPEESVIY